MKPEPFTKTSLQKLFNHSTDIEIKELKNKQSTTLYVYCKPLTDTSLAQDLTTSDYKEDDRSIYQSIQLDTIHKNELTSKYIEDAIFSGKLMLISSSETIKFYNISKSPNRQPDESVAEVSIRGPKDGFVEDITTNIGLIRKRLRTSSFVTEDYTIGKRTQTKVSLLYIKDILNKDILSDIQNRLSSIDIDILTSSSMLIEVLINQKFTLVPLMNYSGRADFVVQCLNQGRFAIVVDGAPTVLIAPTDLSLLYKTPEDDNTSFYFASLERSLRIIGLFITVFLPGFYIALITHNVGQLPLPLIATLTASRIGLPFSPLLEILLMLIMLELFKEGGARLPKGIGQTVAVIGGLIIGDAAIRGGITSPTTLVVIGITAISSFTLVNQSLAGNLFYIRVLVLLLSYFMGIYGFFISLVFIFLYISKLKSFGVPLLSNILSQNGLDILFTFFRLPLAFFRKRASSLLPKDKTRTGD
ncbi:spore germination protein [Ornithinibacillus xuwenensis]|uniref:Spore germination protein n=1 Tax=Ornithinibacillus xuwenensis TaxID=3144668 RepID=A0ABU9XHS9_9BACI